MAIITAAQLKTYLAAGDSVPTATLERVASAASDLVEAACRKPMVLPTPPAVVEAALAIGAEIYKSSEAIGGTYQLADFTPAAGFRLSSNLMRRVDALLAPYADTAGMIG
jgi:hypothetical protein